jgi:hypothetical protein
MDKNMDRRTFLKDSGKFTVAAASSGLLAGNNMVQAAKNCAEGKMIWANLVHLGYNMWSDRVLDSWTDDPNIIKNVVAHPYVRCDMSLWNDIAKRMSEVGMNMMVIDLGEAVKYKSHPELAAEGAWDHKRMRMELNKLRDLGIEPIPKLNFSTGHDLWLKQYHRMVSSPKYYEVCKDIIDEVCEIFDAPRFFHMGYDEETARNQRKFSYVVVRQHELWWHDFNFFVETVLKNKARPWIWSDFAWKNHEAFYEKMPHSVLQSNWYYGTDFHKYPDKFGKSEGEQHMATRIKTYVDLEKAGFDQVPTGSNFYYEDSENFLQTVDFCKEHISAERLKGFMQTPWLCTLETFRGQHMKAIDIVGKAISQCKATS